MSFSSPQAANFYKEVANSKVVWAIKDAGGFPAPIGTAGQRSMPFWSSQQKAQTVIESVPAYEGFHPVAIPWSEFVERWIPGLAKDGLLAGVNWSGRSSTGFDVEPHQLRQNVEAQLSSA
jgi:Protein of unknown function (DUF2750)